MRRDMTIFVYLRSGLPERQGSKMASMTGEGIRSAGSLFIVYRLNFGII
jgi:hypothetical protein